MSRILFYTTFLSATLWSQWIRPSSRRIEGNKTYPKDSRIPCHWWFYTLAWFSLTFDSVAQQQLITPGKTFCDIPIPSGRGTCENASNIFQTICKVEYVSCICLKGSDKCSVHFAVVLLLHAFSCLFRSSLSSFSYLSSSVKETLGWCQKSSVSKGKDVTGVGPQSISLL